MNAVSWAPLLSVGPLGLAAEDDAPRVGPRLISCGCDDELKIWNFREDEINGGWRASQIPNPVLKGEFPLRVVHSSGGVACVYLPIHVSLVCSRWCGLLWVRGLVDVIFTRPYLLDSFCRHAVHELVSGRGLGPQHRALVVHRRRLHPERRGAGVDPADRRLCRLGESTLQIHFPSHLSTPDPPLELQRFGVRFTRAVWSASCGFPSSCVWGLRFSC